MKGASIETGNMSQPESATSLIELSIVVPAYNEARRIQGALDRSIAFFEERGIRGELIVVDDGSRDETAEIVTRAAAASPRVRLVKQDRNRGKGAAVKAGVAASRGKRVLMMDADLSTPLEEIDALSRALDRGAQIATGSRAVATSQVTRSQSTVRVLAGRAGNLWIRLLAVPGVHDTQCGFKLFEGEIARELFARCREERFGIDIEVLCMARRKFGYAIAEVGVAWQHREGSKVKWQDYVDVFLGVPRIVWSVVRSS